MTVALPTGGVQHAEPRFLDRGGILKSLAAGPDQRLDRLGSRWGASFNLRPMKGDDARLWIARLNRGVREKASIKFPQPGTTIQATTDDYVVHGNQLASANALTLRTPSASQLGKLFFEGQFITLVQGGKRYVHQVTSDGFVISSGGFNIVGFLIIPELRIAPLDGSVVEVLAPKIEGYVTSESGAFGWSVDVARIYGLSFDIEEAE